MISSNYWFLLIAIVFEVIATTALAQSESFTRPLPSVIVVVGYAATYWFMSIPLKFMPTGVVYAIWSGLGIVLITAVAWIWYGQKLDLAAISGMCLILAGVGMINLLSTTASH